MNGHRGLGACKKGEYDWRSVFSREGLKINGVLGTEENWGVFFFFKYSHNHYYLHKVPLKQWILYGKCSFKTSPSLHTSSDWIAFPKIFKLLLYRNRRASFVDNPIHKVKLDFQTAVFLQSVVRRGKLDRWPWASLPFSGLHSSQSSTLISPSSVITTVRVGFPKILGELKKWLLAHPSQRPCEAGFTEKVWWEVQRSECQYIELAEQEKLGLT